MVDFFSHIIGSAADSNMALLLAAIMLCALLFEDATIIVVGVLAADGAFKIPLALISLYTGTMLADLILYGIGKLARSHQRLAHYVDHDFTAPFKSWLEARYIMVILSGHFLPGLRSTSYIASGFFGFRFSRYFPAALLSGLVLNTLLFTLSYLFGGVSASWTKELRWGITALLILVFFVIARRNVRLFRKQTDAPPPAGSADTQP